MFIRFAVKLSEVEAGNVEEARQMFAEQLASAEMEQVAFEQRDGSFATYLPPPAGFKALTVESRYYGSHSEYGEGNYNRYFAVPEGVAVPEISLSHGHYPHPGENKDLALLPEGSLEWLDQNGWTPFDRAEIEGGSWGEEEE